MRRYSLELGAVNQIQVGDELPIKCRFCELLYTTASELQIGHYSFHLEFLDLEVIFKLASSFRVGKQKQTNIRG
jgi:hypothetical protein